MESEDNKALIKHALSGIDYEVITNKIFHYINTKKPHLNKQVNLTLFSSELESNYHTVSTVLNKFFKMGFFEFINYLRIEEAKKVHSHSDENHLKVEAVGYECGFNSKSAFYRAFKRFTGLTPNDYIKRLKKEL